MTESQEAHNISNSPKPERVGQEQIHSLLFEEKLSWQAIIYDLINTEQLNPWDIDLTVLSKKYLEKVRELEEANFFISSKVLFAASLLLRIKSDILLNQDLPTIDDVLFGNKKNPSHIQERIELDEELPELVPRTPMSRPKKVTLQELMSALGKAIKTENRRIKKHIVLKQYEKEAEVVMPKSTFNLQDKIRGIYTQLKQIFSDPNNQDELAFSKLLEMSKEEKVPAFVSLLHLDNQQKVWLEQHKHFDEIWILLKELYEEKNKDKLQKIRAELDRMEVEHEKETAKILKDQEGNTETIQEATGFSQEIEKEID